MAENEGDKTNDDAGEGGALSEPGGGGEGC